MLPLKRFVPALLLGVLSTAQAESPPVPWPQITYAPNDDNFHQEQYHDLRVKTESGLRSAIRTVLRSSMFSKSAGFKSDFQFRFPIQVDIKEIPEETLYHGLQGTAGWRSVDGQWVHVLTLNIAAYVQNPEENVDRLLAHEMAHMVLADFMGVQASAAVPMWLNEGLAQSVTDEGRSRVSEFAASLDWDESMLISCALEAQVDSFAHGEGNFQCYPEYYLAVERLNQIAGPTAAGRILRGLKEGGRMADVFQSTTSTDYSLFQKDVDTFTADVIAERKPIP